MKNDYTANSWNNMIMVLSSVEKIAYDANQNEIDNAILDLRKAINDLEKVSRVELFNNKIKSSGSATEAYYKATFALANVWKQHAEKTISKEEIQAIIETLPEHSLKQALMNQ